MKKIFLSIIVAFLIFSGCLNFSYEAEQVFNDDGSSTLDIKEAMGLNSEYFEQNSMIQDDNPDGILLSIMADYYESSEYSDFICGMIEDDRVKECDDSEGSIVMSLELEPDDFYSYESETDIVNLKEVKTYEIRQVPMGQYFILEGAGDDYQQKAQDYLREYVEDNVDDYIDGFYCKASAIRDAVKCKGLSRSGNSVTLEFTSKSYKERKLLWAACSDIDRFDVMGKNATEIKEMVMNPVEIGDTLKGNSGNALTESFTCPASGDTILLATLSDSIYGDLEEMVLFFDLKTEDEVKQDILDSLDNSNSKYGNMGSVSSSNSDDYILDFERSEAMGSNFDQLDSLGGNSADLMMMDISISYNANFPGRIISATIGSEELDYEDNGFEVGLKDLGSLPSDPIVVVVEKQISPLGIYTWVVLLLLVGLVGIGLYLFSRK